ncbi:response regulator FixJ [Phenylobacterium sp.]|jgi:two-component system response regulator FixJ|uniref:response regulator FixJ n=1 Tax=Phenylobacterium sp. TaxID=1871053 RepID=UPI003783516E
MTEGRTNGGVVHVVDDDPALRDALGFLLDTAGFQAKVYDGPMALLEALPNLAVGCILTDVRMPQMSGLDLIRRLRAEGVTHPVIVMTGHADVPLAIEAMRLGVSDFVEKPFDDDLLVSAIEHALKAGVARSQREGERAAILARMEALSGREMEVLQGLVEGKPNKVIAFDLGISARTVEVHRAHVMTKMNARSLSDLVRMSLVAGPDPAAT